MSTAAFPAGVQTAMAKPRILIIEDERGLTEVLSYNLQREGYDVVVAHDGQEGLRKAHMQLPDLVLLDLMLPTLDGLEVCRELRAGERMRPFINQFARPPRWRFGPRPAGPRGPGRPLRPRRTSSGPAPRPGGLTAG